MNRYEPSTPRAACAIGAAMMSVLTFALMVGLPMMSNTGDERVYARAAPETVAPFAGVAAAVHAAAGRAPTTAVADCARSDSPQSREQES